jgi:hypothetical protein
VQEELTTATLAGSPCRLEIATEGEMARLRGAAAIVLQRHSGYHTSTHRSPKNRLNRRKRMKFNRIDDSSAPLMIITLDSAKLTERAEDLH